MNHSWSRRAGTAARISGKAVAAFLAGLLAVACCLIAFLLRSDFFLAGFVLCWLLGLLLGILGRIEVKRAPGRMGGAGLAAWGMAIPMAGCVFASLLPGPPRTIGDESVRRDVVTVMHQIAIAIITYAEEHDGRLPPAVLYDKEGRPLHSWRVLILPYLEEKSLYDKFRLDEPWDSPHNRALLPHMPRVYAPLPELSAEEGDEPYRTFYQVFVGKGTVFEGRGGRQFREAFPDGPTKAILLAEAREAVPWTKPVDLEYDADRPLPRLGRDYIRERWFSFFEPGRRKGFLVALGDASTRLITSDVSETTLRAAITRNKDRQLGPDW